MQKQEAYLSEKTRFEICGCVWKNCGCSTGTWKCLLQVISKFQKQFNPSCAFNFYFHNFFVVPLKVLWRPLGLS